MKQIIRYAIVLLVFLSLVFVARNQAAGAGVPADNSSGVVPVLADPAQAQAQDRPGTVRPPPSDVIICEDDVASVGGISTLEVNNLAPGYCLAAFLRNRAFAVGRIPDGAGQVLANITFLRVFRNSTFVYEVPDGDGDIQICYAVPPGTDAQIYFFDFYGPRFGERTGQPEWEPLETTVEDGVACAAAQTSGAYALIGQ